MLAAIFDLCVPHECPVCRAGYEADSFFCPECEKEFDMLESKPRCRRCAMPSTLPGAPCAQCLGKGVSPLQQIVSLGVLNDPLKSAVHRAKYNHRWPLAERLADRLIHREDVRAMLAQAEVLVPVPLHRQRQRERGYNQAEVIARRLKMNFQSRNSPAPKSGDRSADGAISPLDRRPSGLGDESPAPEVVLAANRIRPTHAQAQLHTRAGRMENLKGAFVLTKPKAIHGKHIVLVDDVLTTGATLVALARTLKAAQPASISAIVLAVADPKGRAFEVI